MFNTQEYSKEKEAFSEQLMHGVFGSVIITSLVTLVIIAPSDKSEPIATSTVGLPVMLVNKIKAEGNPFLHEVFQNMKEVKEKCALSDSNKVIMANKAVKEVQVYSCANVDRPNFVTKKMIENKVQITFSETMPVNSNLYVYDDTTKNKFFKINPDLVSKMIYFSGISDINLTTETNLLKKSCNVSKYEEIPEFGLIDKSPNNKNKYLLTAMSVNIELSCLINDKFVVKKIPTLTTFNYKLN